MPPSGEITDAVEEMVHPSATEIEAAATSLQRRSDSLVTSE
jgi:hypothetical protein